jgi:serine/threonine-protein kinase
MLCPACSTENDAAHESCFSCGQRLAVGPALMKGSLLAGGRYEILSALGRGGMGMVYRAHDRMLEETVALKVLRPDIAQAPDIARRFRSEIKLARKVTHANVCRIHDYGEDGSLGYIAMEIVEGMDLKQLRTRQGPLSTAQAYEAVIQMAEGLQAIHDSGVVHRDLKTSNVMLDANGKIKLMDFGIAKELGGATMGATAMGHVVGTPEYMSPEQARGQKLDFRSDIYSLGIVVYEIFTGHVPFRGDTPIATIYLNLEQPPPLEGPEAAGIPPALVPVLAKALAKDPAERHASARDLAAALRTARSESLPAASPASVPLPAPPPASARDATGTTDLRRATAVPPPTPLPGATAPPTVAGAAPTVNLSAPRPVPQPLATPPPMPSVRRTPAPTPTPPPLPTPKRTGTGPVAKTRPSRSLMPWLALGGTLLAVVAFALFKLFQILLGTEPPTTVAEGLTTSTIVSTTSTIPTTSSSTTSTSTTSSTTPTTSSTTTPTSTSTTVTTTTRPPVVAPPVAIGMLQLVVKPWAEVRVDDQVVGTTPLSPVRLKPGSHTVRLEHPGFRPLQRKITIEPGKTFRLEIDLKQDAIPKR